MSVRDMNALISNRVQAIADYHKSTGVSRAEVDVSGGIDSAVVLMLVARAIGPDNVTAVFQGINSSEDARNRAREVCETAGVRFVDFDGTELFNTFVQKMTAALVEAGFSEAEIADRVQKDPTIMGSIRSTLRAPWGRGANRLTGGGIRHGTGNEDEDRFLRFYQKGGDGEVDTNPIAMLSKGEVFQIARALGVPRSILTARPSPDLWGVGEVHNDEDEIGNYLNLKGCGFPFYSYVNPDTGEYLNMGLIERLARFVDNYDVGNFMFRPVDDGVIPNVNLTAIVESAATTEYFSDVPKDVIRTLVVNAERVEFLTRHKMNPNCPSLGNRYDLVGAGILSD